MSLISILIAVLVLSGSNIFKASAASFRFIYGVASGDVTPNSAILWGQTDRDTTIHLEVSKSFFHSVNFAANVHVTAENDFTAKITATGLEPNTYYVYRWTEMRGPGVGEFPYSSDIGVFKTAPLANERADVNFAWSGDTDPSGTKTNPTTPFFGPWDALGAVQAENPDFFIYLGDIIYSDNRAAGSGHSPNDAKTLPEFRQIYKDARSFSALVTLLNYTSIYPVWDDHEVRNDWSAQTVDRGLYQLAKKAFYEYMPIQESAATDPNCIGPTQFRIEHWGKDIDLIILDTRSCRTANAQKDCGGENPDPVPLLPKEKRAELGLKETPTKCLTALSNPKATILGEKQKGDLKVALEKSTAKFKFVINSVNIQQTFVLPYDSWEGYAVERNEILNFIHSKDIKNVIFLSTDSHLNLMSVVSIKTPSGNAKVADEFVTGPIGARTDKVFLESLPASMCKPLSCATAKQLILDTIGVECRNLNAYSYGSVVYKQVSGSLIVTLKDKAGKVITDDKHPGVKCTKSFP